MHAEIKIAGIGELLWDMLPTGKQLGGAPFNFAFHSMQAGANAYVISAIGKDDKGKEIVDVLNRWNLSDTYVQRCKDYDTGVVDVSLNEKGSPTYTIKEKVAWDFIDFDHSLAALARKLDAVCFGSLAQRNRISRDTILRFVKATRKDCLKVFDINLRQTYYSKEVVLSSLHLADVLKLNEDELPVVARMLGYRMENAIPSLIENFNLKLIAYTQGAKGSILFTADEKSVMEIEKVQVEDTVGAGDAFTAMLVCGMLKGENLKAIHRTASRISSYVCTQKGATPVIPEEYLQFKNT